MYATARLDMQRLFDTISITSHTHYTHTDRDGHSTTRILLPYVQSILRSK